VGGVQGTGVPGISGGLACVGAAGGFVAAQSAAVPAGGWGWLEAWRWGLRPGVLSPHRVQRYLPGLGLAGSLAV